ncbi:hypothetical protein COX69_03100 [Candidatus Falkowbacteria bacterium CG_4_10_14_0_2_um_filter_48_10]|uniref:Uncharacterized protein n=1 Tax=Candidatus Falkowbacteria bacterium CG23_combo_of_CG06-09_8_20_14_all_49_15 TaxID=1974572 RepID=A0A2G9ZKW5_9BACT|nr:MAG: hypothetical protein COX22_02740 [Candidatus Falkowbacteria bacterium CG23_combo_of_CG06-09_8_20_14_all_49_15]PJA08118.1 MAG: hypothetical protein COX69_03100 [Candidatus Falkowbacteria bacterium CG_4_10_14_0_2_um_filter_48_10]
MAYQHSAQSEGAWNDRSFLFQMANIGSEIFRALKWQGKDKGIAERAFFRSLELFDLTAGDHKNRARLKEILRSREAWADFFYFDNDYNTTREQWEKYFLEFNYAANNNK